ncbi:MAG TPA: glycoside hydrolase TIM-barrel-like domain-containing protein [Thermohalobaculum sp.]|nr:glycoside hydrolase TIM-barrel-like domain-containing protein [Thermohalobaculum sp.]
MATVLLSAAGSAIGGSIGGTVLGMSAATIGQAVGAVAGSYIDQTILGSGSRAVEVGRARALHLQTSTEGVAIPRVFGRMRIAGQIIWSTRFKEHVGTKSQGGKATGGQKVKEYSYTISFAVGLCEGPIERVGRIWADGKLLATEDLEIRVYLGDEAQMPDPKIEAVEGAGGVPPYRGLAYVVFEDLPLGAFGNRIPQLNFETFRSAEALNDPDAPEEGPQLNELIQGVALSPGSGEFALDPTPIQYAFPGGATVYANINSAGGRPDFVEAMDQLDGELPSAGAASLLVSWFGDDLRCGRCSVQPRVEETGRQAKPENWSAAGLTTNSAVPVSRDANDRPNYGGTPSDASVIRAIAELTGRGKQVMLYPFLLMDIPPGNALEDPYTGEIGQPVFPWRGRITLDAAPGKAGTTDQSAAAADEVAAFFGTARAADFTVSGGSVSYAGPAEWGWRRFVLHLAALASAAGGVDAICIGSELRGLTTVRSSRTDHPAVGELTALAAEVRALLPDAKIGYAADWSEYFGHHPQDGTGDVLFHLDPLWSGPDIDFVGIDDYTSLSDWRHARTHLDLEAGHKSVYSLPYLQSNVEGGENYDWYYASEADRDSQLRTPIDDTGHGEHWVFRPKDLRGWWSNQHFNRIDGVRQAVATGWVAESKPIWITETGCAAVDLGANQPNLFSDGKSSESALPYGALGFRDDEMQRRFLQAKLGYWSDAANVPVSSVTGEPMIPADRIFVWTWDTRPWPDFPVRTSIWADGPAHRLGHWITGRVSASALARVVAEICRHAGLAQIEVSDLHGVVDGYVIERNASAREALQPLMLAFGFDAFESGGKVVFRMRGGAPVRTLSEDGLVVPRGPGGSPVARSRASAGALPDVVRLSFVQAESDFRVGTSEARIPGGNLARLAETSLLLALPGSKAQQVADRWLAESRRARDGAALTVPPTGIDLEPGDTIEIDRAAALEAYRIERIIDTGGRELEAVRVDVAVHLPNLTADRNVETNLESPPGPVTAIFMDLPLASGGPDDHQPRIAVASDPWTDRVAVYRSEDDSAYALVATLAKPAAIGATLDPLPPGAPDRWQRVSVRVAVPTGTLESGERLRVLNGANLGALEFAPGAWEIIQFRDAVLAAPGEYQLSTLLRGLRGTGALNTAEIAAGARFVLLDDAVAPLPMQRDERGLARHYRVGPARYALSHASYLHSVETFEGVGLRPFAPAHLAARRDAGTGDLALGWMRTARFGADSWQGVEVPLTEESEAYRVRLLSGGALLREVEAMTPGFVYTAAMQDADNAGTTLEVRVAQLSLSFGYGPERVLITNE